MSGQPNFELLKDAYQIIGGIPDSQLKLHSILTRGGPKHLCDTLACAAGWLGLHPQFQALGYDVRSDGATIYKGELVTFTTAMERVFNISFRQAIALFGIRGGSSYDWRAPSGLSDRELWLFRVREFLRVHRQLKERQP